MLPKILEMFSPTSAGEGELVYRKSLPAVLYNTGGELSLAQFCLVSQNMGWAALADLWGVTYRQKNKVKTGFDGFGVWLGTFLKVELKTDLSGLRLGLNRQ